MNWNEVVRTVGPKLHRFFRLRFAAADAADLVQETLIRLVRKVESGAYDPRQGSFAAYAFGIAYYVQKEALKARRGDNADVEALADAADSAPSPEEYAAASAETARLRQATLALSEIERAVVGLLLDRDLSLGEIAAILDLPCGTVKSHVHRAKDKLRQALARGQGALS